MNIKLHTPKTLKTGSGMSSAKQFLLSLIATSVSIILTFGTAAIIDHNKKQTAKKEMVMMIISDIDNSIQLVEKVDTALHLCRDLQGKIAVHPEQFDSLYYHLVAGVSWCMEEFPETTERIFTSSIETFNTIGDVNFVNEVSAFYLGRHKYKEMLMDELKEQWAGTGDKPSLELLFNINFPEYVFMNSSWLLDMKRRRDRCMRMMKVSEDDLSRFSQLHTAAIEQEDDTLMEKMAEEYKSYSSVLEKAKDNLNK